MDNNTYFNIVVWNDKPFIFFDNVIQYTYNARQLNIVCRGLKNYGGEITEYLYTVDLADDERIEIVPQKEFKRICGCRSKI